MNGLDCSLALRGLSIYVSCCLVANHRVLVALADPSARGANTTPHAETTTLRAHVSFRVSNASPQPTFTPLHTHCNLHCLRANHRITLVSRRNHVFTHKAAHAALLCLCHTQTTNAKFCSPLQSGAHGRRGPAPVRGLPGVARTAGVAKQLETVGGLDTIAVSSVYGLVAGERLCEWRSRERRRRNAKGQRSERWRYVAPSPLNL